MSFVRLISSAVYQDCEEYGTMPTNIQAIYTAMGYTSYCDFVASWY